MVRLGNLYAFSKINYYYSVFLPQQVAKGDHEKRQLSAVTPVWVSMPPLDATKMVVNLPKDALKSNGCCAVLALDVKNVLYLILTDTGAPE